MVDKIIYRNHELFLTINLADFVPATLKLHNPPDNNSYTCSSYAYAMALHVWLQLHHHHHTALHSTAGCRSSIGKVIWDWQKTWKKGGGGASKYKTQMDILSMLKTIKFILTFVFCGVVDVVELGSFWCII